MKKTEAISTCLKTELGTHFGRLISSWLQDELDRSLKSLIAG